MKKTIIISIFVAATALVRAQDGTSVFNASLTPDIAVVPSSTQINGLSLNIWGQNQQTGVALGFVNGSIGQSAGFSCGLVNYSESYSGVQFGIVNCSSTSFVGWQDAVVNYNSGTFTGLASGVVNVCNDMNGVQFGGFNYAGDLKGLQIGLINIANNNSWFDNLPNQLAKGFVFVNWSF